MSEEQLKAFIAKVQSDTSLQEKLKAAANPDAVVSIAKEAGFAISAEDIQSMQSSTDLSDEDLEFVAGGAGGLSTWGCRGPGACYVTNPASCVTNEHTHNC